MDKKTQRIARWVVGILIALGLIAFAAFTEPPRPAFGPQDWGARYH